MESVSFFSHVVLPYLNFICFLAIIYFFAKNPARNYVLQQKRDFEKLFQEAQAAKLAAKNQLAEVDEKLKNLEKEIDLVRERSVEEGRLESQRILNNAKTLSGHIQSEAKAIANTELRLAQEMLFDDVLKQVKSHVVKKLKNDFDQPSQRNLIKNQVSSITVAENL